MAKEALNITKGEEHPEEFNPEYKEAVGKIVEILQSDYTVDLTRRRGFTEADTKRATQILRALQKLGYRKLKGKPPDDDIKDCLDCAREAIVDAICCEDGLGGGTGEKVIKWITDILGDYDEWIKTHSDEGKQWEQLIKVFYRGLHPKKLRN